ncbi:ComEC family competence protein [bacterium]|nr:ComEC family competence protein [bacterium]
MFSFLFRRIFLIIAIAFMAGIALAGIALPPYPPVLLSLIVTLSILVFSTYAFLYHTRVVLPIILLLCIALGAARLWLERHIVLSQPLVAIVEAESGVRKFEGRVIGFPRLGGTYVRANVAITRVDDETGAKPFGRMMLFWKSGENRDLTWGDRISFVAAAKLAEPPENPGQFDYRSYLLDRGTIVEGFAFDEKWVRRIDERGFLAEAHIAVRKRLFESLALYQPAELAEVLVSIVYGDKTTDLSPEVEEEFRRAGLTHILVVSGTQVSLIVFLLISLLSPSKDDLSRKGLLNRLMTGVLVISAVVLYCTLTGFETSVTRALLMGILVLAAKLTLKETDGLGELARASMIILAIQPGQLFGASFQLSFAACFGLIYVYGLFNAVLVRMQSRVSRFFAITLVTTGGAQAFVAPILAVHFNQFSLWGLPANLIAIPLASILLLVGLIHNLIGLLNVIAVSKLIAWILSLGLSLLRFTAHFFGNLPGCDIRIATPTWFEIALFYAALILAGEIWRRRIAFIAQWRGSIDSAISGGFSSGILRFLSKARQFIYPAAILCLLILFLIISLTYTHPPRPRLVLLSSGNGLACWIEDSRGKAAAILAPSGNDAVRRNQVRTLKSALDHFGIAAPETIILAAHPGLEGMDELDMMPSCERIRLFEPVLDEIPDSDETPNEKNASVYNLAYIQDDSAKLWAGNGAECELIRFWKGKKEQIAFSVNLSGQKILIVVGDSSQKEIAELMEKSNMPSAVIAKQTSIENARKVASRVYGECTATIWVTYGKQLESAVSIRPTSSEDASNLTVELVH